MESNNSGSDSSPKHFLTQQQKDAVRADLGPTLVIAGAGTGKTLVLAKRFEYLIREKGLDPTRILVVTFTNKATANMKQRIASYIPEKIKQQVDITEELNISTLHSFARRLLIVEDGTSGVVDEERAKHMIMHLIDRMELKITARAIASEIIADLRWICKREGRPFTEQDIWESALDKPNMLGVDISRKFPLEEMRALYDAFDAELIRQNLFTLDDLILFARLRLKHEDTRAKWSKQYDAILIDEFQDLDDVQLDIIQSLSECNKNIFAVGDPDQAIYGFRGAMPRIFDEFQKFFGEENTQIFKLEENFRSTPEILDVANTLINAQNDGDEFRKELISTRSPGSYVSFLYTDEVRAEDTWVIDQIKKIHEEGVDYCEIVILTRNHKHNETIRDRLRAEKISYYYERERKEWAQKPHVQDALAWFVIASGNKDSPKYNPSIKKVINRPNRGDGDKSIPSFVWDKTDLHGEGLNMFLMNSTHPRIQLFNQLRLELEAIAKNNRLSIHEKIMQVMCSSGMMDYYKHQRDRDEIFEYCDRIIGLRGADSWETFLFLFLEGMRLEFTKDDVVISTIHGAKGLEFKYVFLVRFNEGCLPSSLGIKKAEIRGGDSPKENIEDERRLAYVALTRAQDKLHISSSKSPSRFVDDIRPLLKKEQASVF